MTGLVSTRPYYLIKSNSTIMVVGRKYFLNCTKGVFSERLKPGETHEVMNEITGHLVNINFKETGHGEAIRLHVVNENNFYMLSMFTNGRVAHAFFMMAKNLNLQYEMTFKIRQRNGVDHFTIEQFGGPVLWFYSSENASELPRSADEKREFCKQFITSDLLPILAKKLNPYPNNSMYTPARRGLQGGYFDAYESKPVRLIGRSEHEGTPGFGKAINVR